MMGSHRAGMYPSLVRPVKGIAQGQEDPGESMQGPCDPPFESIGGPLEHSNLEIDSELLATGLAHEETAGDIPCCPESRESLLAALEATVDLVAMGRLLAWGLYRGFWAELETCAGPVRLPALRQKGGELFPLPVVLPSDEEFRDNELSAAARFDLRAQRRCEV